MGKCCQVGYYRVVQKSEDTILTALKYQLNCVISIGVGAAGDGGIGPPTFRTGDNPPSFTDVFVTCLWCITLGLHLRPRLCC